MNTKKTAASTAPPTARIATSIEKMPFASFVFPSPRVLAMRALPPVPNMKPIPPNTMMKPKAESAMSTGKMRLSAAKAFLPTQLETKKPSTML